MVRIRPLRDLLTQQCFAVDVLVIGRCLRIVQGLWPCLTTGGLWVFVGLGVCERLARPLLTQRLKRGRTAEPEKTR